MRKKSREHNQQRNSDDNDCKVNDVIYTHVFIMKHIISNEAAPYAYGTDEKILWWIFTP